MSVKKFETEWGGRKLIIEIGKLAAQAHGSCTVQYGDTIVLATAVMGKPKEGMDYFPLTVEYEEKFYAIGKIKSSRFIKRETRPTDEAILSGRLIDRAIRPLFDSRLRNEIQVVLSILSFDQENDPDIPAMIAASCALAISPIPWAGPIAAIRIGKIPAGANDEDLALAGARDGEWVINPTYKAREKSLIDLTVSGTAAEKVIMLESGMLEISEEQALEAVRFGVKHFKKIIRLVEEVQREAGAKKLTVEELIKEEEMAPEEKSLLFETTRAFLEDKINKYLFGEIKETKASRKEALEKLSEELDDYLKAGNINKEKRTVALAFFEKFIEEAVSKAILLNEKRTDGRKLADIRPIHSEVGVLPRTHGSAVFQRGETQVLSTVTLAGPADAQLLDGMEISGKKYFMHHYNFPPFSVGDIKAMRGPGRREIGHGALVERALLPLIPDKKDFPYTIRVVSEVFGSNGSSSMASVCASTLALMDAGVPIKKPVAGIAMGMASDKEGNFKILTDLQDLEDSEGGMDFKVAGTKDGITSIQMDTKTDGLTLPMVEQTLERAKKARLQILALIEKVLSHPRTELSPYAPRVAVIQINPEKIRDVIGPGGKVINEIITKLGVTIDVEQDGTVTICSLKQEALNQAVEWVRNLTAEVEVGKIYHGKVVRVLDFGAFVEALPNQEGLVHISELAPFRVESVTDVVKIGDVIPVKVVEIDQMGRINLSLRQARDELGEKQAEPPARDGGGFVERRFPPRPQRKFERRQRR